MYYLGLDLGSLSCDAVLIDAETKVLATAVVFTGARNLEAIERAKSEVITAAGIAADDIRAMISTGYGRDRVEGRLAAVTEITCHARGVKEALEDTRVLIDIGGQDSKAILLTPDGRVDNFAMNDKCAAGTGRFLEAMARALQVDIEQLGQLDQGATQGLTLSSMCTVFAESEVVSLIADGTEVKEIVKGLNRSIASRTASMVKRICPDLNGMPIAMSGGVAHNRGVVRALEEVLGCPVTVPPRPDTIGALGASLIAHQRSH